jgi:RNA polymerase sigma-70 factor (ECF subfamily)
LWYPFEVADDLELWRAWTDGDEDAGNRLVRRFFLGVHRFFQSKVADHADELTQKTFLACVESRDRFRGQASFRSYLFGIARKQLLRHFEGRGRGLSVHDITNTTVHDLDPSPSRVVAQLEDHAVVLEALRRIPLDHQVVIELCYWEELSLAEVADVLDVPVGTVKSRLSRAKAQLREQLDVSGDVVEPARRLGRALREE